MRAARTARPARRGDAPRPGPLALWTAYATLAAGAVLCVLGWYGVSGERFAERQLPYLASCTAPGAALIIAGAVLYTHGRSALAASRVEELYTLLVATEQPPAEDDSPTATSEALLMVPGGTLRHRADCPLVKAKREATPPDPARDTLDPCPICDPPGPRRPPPPDRPDRPEG
ncbi:hypothetical protein [Streptomyces sp. NRRL S-1521]|uniref:hypothetical protein n=1 Tax=Streptomyces sp. NRRL S-1521 TaxID=1609100 RepID=UPI00074AA6BA|nr:hypothetical protein [Streptomyces sp. NRRL S-1521]KUL59294.1 hypothetical protein ADL30_09085 [Streptomyces sp. NRRL S-1521]